MEVRYALTYTVYSHNLWQPHRSFAPDISIDDFGRMVWKDALKADRIVYVNPRGQSIILKDKNGVK